MRCFFKKKLNQISVLEHLSTSSMLKITQRLVAVALAATSIAAFAQNVTSGTDSFGQPVTRLDSGQGADVPTQSQRVIITNSPNRAAGMGSPEDPDATDEDQSMSRNGYAVPGAGRPQASTRQQMLTGRAAEMPPSEFQKFLFDGTGKILPVFGSEFFANAPKSFTPISGAPVPADYPLGAGDELTIRGWGSIDIEYRATIDRNGLISIPKIGSVVLAGVRAGDAEAVGAPSPSCTRE
jgi:hypothetical protein